ncbi:hypothetical protein Meth11DRAFT_1136 [Methylophilaceae bacterium 11]|nr:hypothetical protein Meth11DRAFT_1136 [Methylophilaceae bacterium 11]
MSNVEKSKLIALKLASLPESDFNWIYDRLNQNVKDRLGPLVNEVRAIGINLSAGEINDLFENHATSKDNHKNKENVLYSEMIDQAGYQNIEDAFKSEPSYLLFALSGLHDWHWKTEFGYKNFVESKMKRAERIELKALLAKSMIAATESLLQDKSTSRPLLTKASANSTTKLKGALERAPVIKRLFKW